MVKQKHGCRQEAWECEPWNWGTGGFNNLHEFGCNLLLSTNSEEAAESPPGVWGQTSPFLSGDSFAWILKYKSQNHP